MREAFKLILIALEAPFQELYCHLRYEKSWHAHMDDQINAMLDQLAELME